MAKISAGTVHTLPKDLHQVLLSKPKMLALWETFTPLARTEWICWIEDAKKPETRARRLKVGEDKMMKGMRRPCCWAGCPHR
jgi:uncharacterized protein YdeI (YjbR/CyaY-like superfamily)